MYAYAQAYTCTRTHMRTQVCQRSAGTHSHIYTHKKHTCLKHGPTSKFTQTRTTKKRRKKRKESTRFFPGLLGEKIHQQAKHTYGKTNKTCTNTQTKRTLKENLHTQTKQQHKKTQNKKKTKQNQQKLKKIQTHNTNITKPTNQTENNPTYTD